MIGYSLPKSVQVDGADYPIRTDFRAVLDVLVAMNDPELDSRAKTFVLLKIMFPNLENIPQEHLEECCKKVCKFIDCGQEDDGKPRPKMIDWEQDAPIIIPAINSVAHTEIRALPELHWWTFFGYFMEIRESLLSSVLNIRNKLYKHKKLEKNEQEFYKENKSLVNFQKDKKLDDDEIEFWENLLK